MLSHVYRKVLVPCINMILGYNTYWYLKTIKKTQYIFNSLFLYVWGSHLNNSPWASSSRKQYGQDGRNRLIS